MELRVVQTTPKLILEWDPVPGAVAGYRGRAGGVEKWTQTQQTRMTFAKDATGIVIQALGIVDRGEYPPPPTPPTGGAVQFGYIRYGAGEPPTTHYDDYDPILVSGFWGLEVYDLATGERVARRRLGFVGRQAAIAPAAGLVFVPTFFEGKIRVYERESLELLGKIPIGMYVRYPHVSSDEKRFFASSLTAHYYWDLNRLEQAFEGGVALAALFAR